MWGGQGPSRTVEPRKKVKEFVGNDWGKAENFCENTGVPGEIVRRYASNTNYTCYHLVNLFFLLFLNVFDEDVSLLVLIS
jgi:hypothetical protein